MKYCFGIDVGGTTIKCGLFTEDGELIGQWSVPTRIGGNGALIYDDVAAAVKQKIAEKNIREEDCIGVGMDMPGTVFGEGEFGFGNNIAIIGGFPAKEVASRLGGMKVVLANDANAAAFGEMWMGAGKNCRSMCMVTLGTGVGGGVIEAGKIIGGFHGAAGEIGHLCVEQQETEQCNCGGHGCMEFYASATGIVRVAKRMIQTGDPMIPVQEGKPCRYGDSPMAALGDALSAKDVCELAKAGDGLANRVLDFSMDRLGLALSYVTFIADPEVFVIGGGVAAAGEILFERVRKAIRKYTPLILDEGRAVVGAKLGSQAGIYGAAALVKLSTR